MNRLSIPLVAASLALLSGAAQAITATAASVQITATATAGGAGDGHTDSASWGVLFDELRAQAGAGVSAGASDTHGESSATSGGTVLAQWSAGDASAGTVQLSADWQLKASDRDASAALGEASPAFRYSFVAGSGESLHLSYTQSGADFIAWAPVLSGGSAGPQTLDASGVGQFSLVAGTAYTLSLAPVGGVWSQQAAHAFISAQNASTTATLNWSVSVSAVPEPASALMSLAGLAVVGSAWRRRGAPVNR